MTSDTLTFSLQSPKPQRMVYRPWGTRSLKVLVTTQEAENLRIRPSGINPDEQKNGLFRAVVGDGAFEISWGGGHEEGPCLKGEDFMMAFEKCTVMEPHEDSLLYFNVRHTGGHAGDSIPDTVEMALEAYNPKNGEVKATLPVTLVKPVGFDAATAVHMQRSGDTWKPVGTKLPTYDSRWWPGDFDYVDAGDLPLTVHRESNDLIVTWNGAEVTRITDHTDPSILDMDAVQMELFRFDEWHVALRVWFFWLDKNVGHGFFVGRHEVPDAERFDFLIRREDGRVTQACTDLHWREVWGFSENADTAVVATIGTGGLSREAKLDLLKEKLLGDDDHADHKGVHNPLETVQLTSESVYGFGHAAGVRAKGTEAHLPILHHVEQFDGKPSIMTSSDVRKG